MILFACAVCFILGGMVGAAVVYIYEIGVLRDFSRRVAAVEKGYEDMLAVAKAETENKTESE